MKQEIKHYNGLLQRQYFENDKFFYSREISLSCFEQVKYQSLRRWNVDFFLYFCEDINIELSIKSGNKYLKTHNLKYNNALWKYHCLTRNAKCAEECIEQILMENNPVIFRTAMDYLHTYSWYHETEPYTRKGHYSNIVGCDKDNFYYTDIPPTRNDKYFVSHPQNSAVGIIEREELLSAFQYFCEIGYIEINTEYIQHVAEIKSVLKGIVENYYNKNSGTDMIYIGRQALEYLSLELKCNSEEDKLFLDEFVFELYASRHILLKINLCKYGTFIEKNILDKCIKLLDELTNKWRTIRNLVIKNEMCKQYNISERMAHIVERKITPLTEELMFRLGNII